MFWDSGAISTLFKGSSPVLSGCGVTASMDKDAFEKSLPAFNSILVKNLNVAITQNFVKNSAMASYIYVKARLPETANSHRNEEGNEQTLEFTISYDPFYNVPVFHFRINMLLEHVSAPCAADIHPILQTPYLCVHPCETAATMDEWKPESPLDYMVKWIGMVFSLVLPEVQLRYNHTSPESRVITINRGVCCAANSLH